MLDSGFAASLGIWFQISLFVDNVSHLHKDSYYEFCLTFKYFDAGKNYSICFDKLMAKVSKLNSSFREKDDSNVGSVPD